MASQKQNPAAPARALAGSEMQSRGATHSDHTTIPFIINRLQQRFAISALHAATIASLAGLGPREAH